MPNSWLIRVICFLFVSTLTGCVAVQGPLVRLDESDIPAGQGILYIIVPFRHEPQFSGPLDILISGVGTANLQSPAVNRFLLPEGFVRLVLANLPQEESSRATGYRVDHNSPLRLVLLKSTAREMFVNSGVNQTQAKGIEYKLSPVSGAAMDEMLYDSKVSVITVTIKDDFAH